MQWDYGETRFITGREKDECKSVTTLIARNGVYTTFRACAAARSRLMKRTPGNVNAGFVKITTTETNGFVPGSRVSFRRRPTCLIIYFAPQ